MCVNVIYSPARGHCFFFTPYPRDLLQNQKRIWPFRDFLGVLPDHVVLPKDEKRPVDGEAVLPDRDGVVQGHGACTLRFGLLKGWGDATGGHGRPIAVSDAVGPSIPRAQQARDIVPEPGHSVQGKRHGKEDSVRRDTGPELGVQPSWARCCARRESTGDPGDPLSPSPLCSQKTASTPQKNNNKKTSTSPAIVPLLRTCVEENTQIPQSEKVSTRFTSLHLRCR